ncbi:MAG: SusD/RagB family nutrient-binding outer membrane lipoprotein [Mangrovibacterium sp.]
MTREIKMKHYILALICAAICSCTDLQNMNNDPNNPTETSPSLLLTNIQWETFYSSASSDAALASRYIVDTDGKSNNQYWSWNRGSFSSYADLADVVKMEQEAENNDQQIYVGLAKFFKAYYFYNLALTFGDIPCSESLRAETDSIYSPKYDAQEDVFSTIITYLNEGAEILKEEAPNYASISGDIIASTPSAWIEIINSFKLKVLMTLSNKSTIGQYRISDEFKSTVEAGNILKGTDNEAKLEYLDQQDNRYVFFNSSSFGSARYMDSTFVKTLQMLEDPRLFTFAERTKNAQDNGLAIDDFSAYEGGNPVGAYAKVNEKATKGNVSKVDSRYYENPTNEQQILVSYAEQELILAEAILRGWISGDAQNHFSNAVRASFKFYADNASDYAEYLGADMVEDYLAQSVVMIDESASFDENLEKILTQKYIRSFFQNLWTPYFEYLRTGYPQFLIPDDTSVPKRWQYPTSEYNNNANNVQEAINSQFSGDDIITLDTWWLK